MGSTLFALTWRTFLKEKHLSRNTYRTKRSRIRAVELLLLFSFCFHICWYVIIVEDWRAPLWTRVFVFWGKWWSISTSGIPRRLSPSLQTPRYSQRSFGQWPRDYIFRRCARGVVPQKGVEGGLCPLNSLVESHGANQPPPGLPDARGFFLFLQTIVKNHCLWDKKVLSYVLSVQFYQE